MEHSRKQNKRKNLIILISTILLVSLFFILFFTLFNKKNIFSKNTGLTINNSDYYLEVAQTNQERKKGLSNRDELCSNCGMLFIFDKEDKHEFWMKDTHIPLDIIWLNSQKQIVKIIVSAPTNSETIYANQTPAKYAIELPANESLKLNLQIGDTLPIFDDK